MIPTLPSGRTARILFCIFLLFPLFIYTISIWPGTADEWRNTLSIFDRYALRRLLNSAALATVGSFFALLFAIPVHALYLTLSSKGRRVLTVLSLLPLSYPTFGVASVWMTLVTVWDQTSGGRLIWETGRGLSQILFSIPGGGWILGLCYWPIVFLALTVSAEPAQSQFEAALLTMKSRTIARKVFWPAWRLPLSIAAVIIFCLGLLQFETPSLLQINVYPLEIFIRFTALLSEWSALILCIPYLLIVLILSGILYRATSYFSLSGREYIIQPISLKTRIFIWMGTGIVLILSCVVPLFGSLANTGSLGFTFGVIWDHRETILRSIIYCLLASVCIIGLGFWYTADRSKRDHTLVPSVFLTLFVIPGILIASAWLRVRLFWPGVTPEWVALLSLLGAFISHGFILGYGAGLLLWNYYGQRQREYDLLLRIGPLARSWRLYIPALWRPGLQMLALTVLFLWGDVAMTFLLNPPGGDTLPVEYFNLLHYGSDARTAAIGLAMMFLPASILLIVFLGIGGKSQRP